MVDYLGDIRGPHDEVTAYQTDAWHLHVGDKWSYARTFSFHAQHQSPLVPDPKPSQKE